MRLRKRLNKGKLSVALSGVLRASPHSIQLFEQLMGSIDKDVHEVELDLAEVLFVDSLWIGFLVTLSTHCRDKGVTLRITAVSKQLWRVLEQTNIAQVLTAVNGHVGNNAHTK